MSAAAESPQVIQARRAVSWKTRLFLIAAVVFYQVLLNTTYIYFISPLFQYVGFVYNPLPLWRLLALNLFALIPAFWLSPKITRPSQIVEWILFLLVYVPASILPSYILRNSALALLELDLALLASFAVLSVTVRLRWRGFIFKGMTPGWFLLFLYFAVLLFVILISISVRFEFHLVRLSKVYDVRSEFAQKVQDSPLLGYCVPWLSQVLAPILIAIGIIRRRKLHIIAGVAAVLLVYSVTGFKSALFAPVLIIGIKKMLDWGGNRSGLLFPVLISAFLVFCLVVDYVLGFPALDGLFVHRLLVIPGVVTGYYYDFFSHHPFEMLAHSILRPFLASPYSQPVPFVIGRYYWSSPKTDANANFWATAYSDFGFLGMMFFSFALGAVLNLYDSIARNLDFRLACMLIVFPAMILSNSALLTALLTQGVGALIVMLMLIPRTWFDDEREPAREARAAA